MKINHTVNIGSKHYCVLTLWALTKNLPTEMRDLYAFAEWETWCWGDLDHFDMMQFADEVKRVMRADTYYPILICAETGAVLDGLHRVCKLYLEGKQVVNCRIVTKEILEKAEINENN